MEIKLNFETVLFFLFDNLIMIFVQHSRLICLHSFIMKEYKCDV